MPEHPSPLILVVDDDRISRLALAGVLARVPLARVVEADDGQAAWDLMADGLRPDLCCTDLQMPRLDGLALMARVRADTVLASLPFLMITGSADLGTVQAAMRHQAAGFIVKPFRGPDTRSTVERVLRESQARRAERPLATCQRLHQDRAGIARLLSMLLEEVEACLRRASAGELARLGAGTATDDLADVPADDLDQRLARVRSGCRTLGLWEATRLAEQARPDQEALLPLLQGVAQQVRTQRGWTACA